MRASHDLGAFLARVGTGAIFGVARDQAPQLQRQLRRCKQKSDRSLILSGYRYQIYVGGSNGEIVHAGHTAWRTAGSPGRLVSGNIFEPRHPVPSELRTPDIHHGADGELLAGFFAISSVAY